MKNLYIFISLNLFTTIINAQNGYLDDLILMDKYRINQISGDSNILHSFLFRSTSNFQHISYKDKSQKLSIIGSEDIQYNSLLPISYNDGNLFPSRGWQTRHTIGIYYKNKIFEINFQPEAINTQNKPQEYYAGNTNDGNFAARYFGYVANNIDNFRQFGKKSIDTLTLGQSRIGLHFDKIAVGISNQNYWIGPGRRNSLTMSNNAAGFKHFYFSSNNPINTPIGEIEFTYVNGIIDTLKYQNPDVGLLSNWSAGIAKKYMFKRSFHQFSFSWSPRWTKGLFLGYSLAKQEYITSSVIKDNDRYNRLDTYNQKLGSLFFRLLLSKETAEIYGEFGLPDIYPNLSRFYSEKPKTGIIIGASKVLFLSKQKKFINLNFELAQLQLMDSRSLFKIGQPFNGNPINSWYTNTIIQQGYTNEGQIMGASIGPGSNSQTFNLSWNNPMLKIGTQLERIVNNNDFYFIQYYIGKNVPGINGKGAGYYNRYWVDLNASLYLTYNLRNRISFLVNIMHTNTMNYRWVRNEDGSAWNQPSSLSDKYNVRFNLSIRYKII